MSVAMHEYKNKLGKFKCCNCEEDFMKPIVKETTNDYIDIIDLRGLNEDREY